MVTYQMVKRFENMFTCLDTIHERDSVKVLDAHQYFRYLI